MKVRLEWYGPYREILGTSGEEAEFPGGDVRALFAHLAAGKISAVGQLPVGVAVNDVLADWETPLAEGDLVVFLLPMGGG
jgi:molybdopterin converting factor small subunit